MSRATLLLADDHTVVMEGLRKLLEPHFEISGAVDNARELVAAAKRVNPDVILLDISMPGMSGLDAAVQLRKTAPRSKLIFLTMHSERVYVTGAFRVGAHGYILKRCAAAELVSAIQTVLRGSIYVTPEISRDFPESGLPPEALHVLTAREREVLSLIAAGKSAKEIAAILNISPRTVAFHKCNIGEKLGVHTVAELTRVAIRQGLSEN